MASSGTPFEGRDRISDRVYDGGVWASCYANAQNSLDENSVYADLVFPSGSGANLFVLFGSWNETNGVVTYDHGTPDDLEWKNTNPLGGANWSLPVTGIALWDVNLVLLHWHDLAVPSLVMTPQRRLRLDLSSLTPP